MPVWFVALFLLQHTGTMLQDSTACSWTVQVALHS